MSDHLTASLQSFQSKLSTQEQSDLSSMERAAMIAETRDLLSKTRRNNGGAMGMNRTAQETLTKPVDPIKPVQPIDGPPAGDKTGQGAEMPTPDMQPPPVTGQAALPAATPPSPPPAPPPAPPTPVTAQQPAGGIESYIDEKEDQASDNLSGGEMGLKDQPGKIAAYVEAYGHLRIRPTVKNALEVFDPHTNTAIMLVRPNTETRKNAQRLRRCAVDVLANIAHHGLVKTAQMWKAQIKKADGGVVDYGTNVMQTKQKFSDDSINDRGENTMQQDITLGVDSTTGEGDNLAAEEKPETRQPAGLSGKSAATKSAKSVDFSTMGKEYARAFRSLDPYSLSDVTVTDPDSIEGPDSAVDAIVEEVKELAKTAIKHDQKRLAATKKVPEKGGILPAHETNMADAPAKSPEGNSLSSLDSVEDNMEDKRQTKSKGSDSTLDDAITTFANETLTAGLRRAQATQPGEPPMGMEMPKGGGCGGFKPKTSQQPGMDQPMPPPVQQTAQGMPGAPPPAPPPMPQTSESKPAEMKPAEMKPAEMDPNMSGQPPMPQTGADAELAPPAPGMGSDVLPPQTAADEMDPAMMTDEQKVAHLYRKRAEKLVAANTRKFIARFVRCLRVAARRQALNLEPNQLKIAVADALMTETPISKHEVYVPMDARTASFVIERGLDQRNALSFVDSLIKRSAAFMKMSDEALTQVEDDLENIQPVTPTEKAGQATDPSAPSVMPKMPQMADPDPGQDPSMAPEMAPGMGPDGMPMQAEPDPDPGIAGMPEDMQMDDPMQQTEDQRAASMRHSAASGNLPINPGAMGSPPAHNPNDKRSQIRFAVGATKNAGLHNFFGRGQ